MKQQQAVFVDLFTRYYRTIESYIWRRVNDRALAEDLTSEAFARAWAKHQVGTDITIGWLLKTARNLVGNEYQRRDYEKLRLERIALDDVTKAMRDVSSDVELHVAMSKLRPQDALVLQLTYWDGLSAAESAQYLGCTTAALWVRLTRARASLEKLLADSGPLAAAARHSEGGSTHG